MSDRECVAKPMRRMRRAYRYSAAALVFGIAVVGLYAWATHDPVHETFSKIEPDMTKAQVIRIMGKETSANWNESGGYLFFQGNNGVGIVVFTRDWSVVRQSYWEKTERPWLPVRLWNRLTTAAGI